MSRNSNDRPRATDPPSSVSSGSIDLEALRAKLEHRRQQAPDVLVYIMVPKDWIDEVLAVLASLGERRGTQEEETKAEARVDDAQYAAPLATASEAVAGSGQKPMI